MKNSTPLYQQTASWLEETAALRRFARALRKDDADFLNELLTEAQKLFPADETAGLNPLTVHILCLLMVLSRKLSALQLQVKESRTITRDLPNTPKLAWFEPKRVTSGTASDIVKPPLNERYTTFIDPP